MIISNKRKKKYPVGIRFWKKKFTVVDGNPRLPECKAGHYSRSYCGTYYIKIVKLNFYGVECTYKKIFTILCREKVVMYVLDEIWETCYLIRSDPGENLLIYTHLYSTRKRQFLSKVTSSSYWQCSDRLFLVSYQYSGMQIVK